MYYYTYEIYIDDPESSFNGKFYYGKHETTNLDDGYFGSGTLLLKYISVRGVSHLKKKILGFYANRQALNIAEKQLVDIMKSQLQEICLNRHEGGSGGHWVEYLTEEELEERKNLIKKGIYEKTTPEQRKLQATLAGLSKRNATPEQKLIWREHYINGHKNCSKEDKERRYLKVSKSVKQFYDDPNNQDKVTLMKENNRISNQISSKLWRNKFKEIFGCTPEFFRKFGLMKISLNLFKDIQNLSLEEARNEAQRFVESNYIKGYKPYWK